MKKLAIMLLLLAEIVGIVICLAILGYSVLMIYIVTEVLK